jgi:hypothetical protein
VGWSKAVECLKLPEVLWYGQPQEQGDTEYELGSEGVKVAVLKVAEACSSCFMQKTRSIEQKML